ncbi:polysaccharide pyruvyl transferase family protein [Streptosporangium sp. NPDC051022]|uniref:polysaccharide pyruvyl transferase family protein n=1 Tax=Streptosporangium sp. NPDC051022 TaxID=3155752 RepID=UPI0034247F8A
MSQRIAIWAGSSLPNVGDRLLAAVTEAELSRRLPGASFTHFCPWSTAGTEAAGAESAAAGPVPLWVDRAGRWPGAGSFDAVVMAGGLWSGPPFRHSIMQVFCLGPAPWAFDPDVWVAWHGVGLQDGTPAAGLDHWRGYLGSVRERLDHLTVRSAGAARRMDEATGGTGDAGGTATPVVPDPSFALPPLPAERPRRRRPLIGVAVGAPGPTAQLVTHLVGRDLAGRCPHDPALCVPPEQVLAEASDPAEGANRIGFVTELGLTLIELAAFADLEFITVPNIYGDEEAGARFARSVPSARNRTLGSTGSDELTEALARCDLVLVSRYHSAILALRSGTPFVAVDPFWSRRNGTSKLHELAVELGMAHRHWAYRGADTTEDLMRIVERALDEEPVEEQVYRDMHLRATAAFDRLAEELSAAGPARANRATVTLGRSI